jgi:raffinose/stachyose/melibiose transport system substrate-binding protein
MTAKMHRAVTVAVMGLVLGTSVAARAEGVTLTVWHNTQDTPGVLGLYEAYEKASGNKIELVGIPADDFQATTLTRWASGDRPDVLEYFPNLANLDRLNPSQNLVDLSDEDFVARSGIYELGGRASDGKVYAAITTFPETWGLYYNKKVLAEHGLTPATTFAEVLAQCPTLSRAGITTLHQAGGSVWPVYAVPLVYASGIAEPGWVADVVDRKAKFDDPDSPWVLAMQAWIDMRDAGCFNSDMTTATFEQSARAVHGGEAAYHMIHSNIAAVYLDVAGGDAAALDETVGFVGVGATKPATVMNAGPIGSFMVPKTGNAEREAAALDFIRFVTGAGYEDYIQASGTFPIQEGVADPANTSELLRDIKAAYDKGPRVILINQNVPGGDGSGLQVVSEVSVGQLTPVEAAAQLQQGVAAAAQAQGLPGW